MVGDLEFISVTADFDAEPIARAVIRLPSASVRENGERDV
jgi:hypothetical protein